MIQNKVLKMIVSIIIAILMILGISSNMVFAETTINTTIKLSGERYVKDSNGVYQKKNAYVLNTGSDHKVFQIAEYEGDTIVRTNLYCLNATEGYTWINGTVGQEVTYNKAYDLVSETDKTTISGLNSIYSDILNTNIYTQVMWILDNMYMEGGETVDGLLNKAGIVYGTNPVFPTIEDWHYNSSTMVWPLGYSGYHYTYPSDGQRYDVVLSEEEVEVVQQAAIWYFTNYIAKGNEEYNCYTNKIGDASTNGTWFSYTETTTGDDETDALIKAMKQEQAAILFNYLVDGANAATENKYNSSEEATLDLSYVSETQKITEDGDNYVIGPMIATTTGNVTDLEVTVKTGTSYGTTIDSSNVSLKDKDGNVITEITPGEQFTVVIQKTKVDGNVQVIVTGTGTTTTKLLLVSNNSNAEQPIVEVEKKTIDLEDKITAEPPEEEIEKLFDLALRKQIVAVNGENTSTYIVNEDGNSAIRTMNVSTSTIPDTAIYKHRKDPVVVNTGDIVTYRIWIYNEGEIDGYASKIVDQLADNLGMATTMGTTVTSNKGNVYDVSYDSTNNQITLKIDTTSITSLSAYDGETLDSDYVDVKCVVNQVAEIDGKTKHYLTNIAYIAEEYDVDGNKIEQDRTDESIPNNTNTANGSNGLNVTDVNNAYNGSTNGNIINTGTNNDFYFAGQEDDDDFETVVVLPQNYDLALRKFITAVSPDGTFSDSTTTTYSREPKVDTSKLGTTDADGNLITTAEYNHSKDPVSVDVGDYVLYTIRVYNEGNVAASAAEITDYLPEYLDFIDATTNEYIDNINSKWEYDAETRKIKTTQLATTTLAAFDSINDDGNGSGLDFADVQVICKVNSSVTAGMKLTNIAEISKYADEDGNIVDDGTDSEDDGIDIDSDANDLDYPDDLPTYKDDEIARGDEYIPGQEDDDDFEKVVIRAPGQYDLVLIKQDENGEQLDSTATFEVNGEEKQVTGKLIIADDVEINKSNVSTSDVYTIKETVAPDEYCEFEGIITVTVDKELSSTGEYVVKSIDYTVTDTNGNEFETEDAVVYLNEDGNIYVEVKDYEEKDFDLALRKFITDVSGEKVTTRIPEVSYKDGKITYTHPKDVVKVVVGDIVTYTIRVYNEGELAGYAQEITDDIPDYLEYLPDNDINKEYRWIMYDKDGKETTEVNEAVKIVTDYTSKEYGEELMTADSTLTENPNLLSAFNSTLDISETNPDYVDVKVAFKVLDPDSNTYVITNKAQISEDADEDGKPVDDIDSIPNEWNDGEDDQDYENVSVEYFDLSLLKYVTKVFVTENGTTTTTKTGNTGVDTDIVPKVEISSKKLNKTTVKFEYTIKITNEGDIAGYAKEITDYVPEGLKFYAEDNSGWTDEGNNVISTKLLENTLLQPGESATVKVTLRWINGSDNLGVKTNVAEISEDYNEKGVPDKDSTPDNKKDGEDDIDDAPVLLAISTGLLYNVVTYVGGTLIILVILAGGIALIKKYVL